MQSLSIQPQLPVSNPMIATMSSDISSSLTSTAQSSSTPATPLHFDVIIKLDYVEKPNATLKSGAQRRKQFSCRSTSWSTPHRTNAISMSSLSTRYLEDLFNHLHQQQYHNERSHPCLRLSSSKMAFGKL